MNYKHIILYLFFICSSDIIAQGFPSGGGGSENIQILGSTQVTLNSQTTYTAELDPGVTANFANWNVYGGAQVINETNSQITINWNSTGSKTLEYSAITSQGAVEGNIAITVSPATAPLMPTTPSISAQNCNNATLARSSAPPANETWYWQGTNPNGTSLANSGSSYTVSSSGRYYLRARNSSGIWSTNSAYRDVSLGSVGGSVWYADHDQDGLGDPQESIISCQQPQNFVSNKNDQCPSENAQGGANGCPPGGAFSDENYIYNLSPQIPSQSVSGFQDLDDAIENIVYYDGLGRVKQSIGIKHSPTEDDVLTHTEYDRIGRRSKTYLPVPIASGANGSYRSENMSSTTGSFYQNKFVDDFETTVDANPYTETEFESSPGNRPKKVASPGHSWRMGSGHEVELDYTTNTTGEVKKYGVIHALSNNTYIPTLQLEGSYESGQLYKTTTYDENHTGGTKNNTTEEFKNKRGLVVLRRTYANMDLNGNGNQLDPGEIEVSHDTYYVYDKFQNLTYVIPPKAQGHVGLPDPVELAELCYQYIYDYRNRLVEKRIPGSDWERIVYNRWDQPIMTQNGHLKNLNQWLFTKYDPFGRAVYSGIFGDGQNRTRATLQAEANSSLYKNFEVKSAGGVTLNGTFVEYSNQAYPTTGVLQLHNINYYDNYSFDRDGMQLPSSSFTGASIQTSVKGLLTGTKVRVLDSDQWIISLNGYDKKDRMVYAISKNNYLSTTDIVESEYDFADKVLQLKTRHTYVNDLEPTTTTLEKFEYDHVGRLEKQTHKINNQPEIAISVNQYDNMGQLVAKSVGGLNNQAGLQDVNYNYNVRGWLKSMNNTDNMGSDLFAFELAYDQTSHSASPLFNGNISESEWKTASDNTMRWYSYEYDALNRLTSAVDGSQNQSYSLQNVAYDRNGNILKLKRKGHINNAATIFGPMDDLEYVYQDKSNKLKSVLDNGNRDYGFIDGNLSATDFEYNTDGNLKRDYNKGINTDIQYNYLNLPKQVNLPGGTITYKYDATGTKQQKIVSSGGSTDTYDYVAGRVYKNNILEYFSQPEGYIENNGGSFDYIYQYKDHLGSIRLSYKNIGTNASPDLQILEENNYYPFGLEHKGYNNVVNGANSAASKYKYNGKEHQQELGLDWYDYGARNYDPALGRWMNIDPLAELMTNNSPYNYAFNNPIFFIDPDGMAPMTIYQLEGTDETVEVIDGSDEVVEVNQEQFDQASEYSKLGTLDTSNSNWNSKNGQEYDMFRNEAMYGENASWDRVASMPEQMWDGLVNDVVGDDYQNPFVIKPIIGSPDLIGGPGLLRAAKTAKVLKAGKTALPALDTTGKVHGTLPKIKDLAKYSKDELKIMVGQLKKSVQQRIKVTSKLGRDRGHGQRQGAEQDLIKAVEKYLKG